MQDNPDYTKILEAISDHVEYLEGRLDALTFKVSDLEEIIKNLQLWVKCQVEFQADRITNIERWIENEQS